MRLVWKKKWEVREEILLFEAKNRFDRQVQVKCRLTVSPKSEDQSKPKGIDFRDER